MPLINPREHPVARLSELDPAPSKRPFKIGETNGLLVRLPDGLHAVSGENQLSIHPLRRTEVFCLTYKRKTRW